VPARHAGTGCLADAILDDRYADLPAEQQAVFVRLLDQDDMALFDWITGACASPAEFRSVVEDIKTTRHSSQQR
jgi:succinate dehydrogenase flavin-adding protein (antitoxin of CptAB toxin-antitoxin module)